MNKINDILYNGTTWGFTVAGIAVNWESLKANVLFIAGFILAVCQIIHWVQKILGYRK